MKKNTIFILLFIFVVIYVLVSIFGFISSNKKYLILDRNNIFVINNNKYKKVSDNSINRLKYSKTSINKDGNLIKGYISFDENEAFFIDWMSRTYNSSKIFLTLNTDPIKDVSDKLIKDEVSNEEYDLLAKYLKDNDIEIDIESISYNYNCMKADYGEFTVYVISPNEDSEETSSFALIYKENKFKKIYSVDKANLYLDRIGDINYDGYLDLVLAYDNDESDFIEGYNIYLYDNAKENFIPAYEYGGEK